MIKFPYPLLVTQDMSLDTPEARVGFHDEKSGFDIFDATESVCGRFKVDPSEYGLTQQDVDNLALINQALTSSIEVALNAACYHIQERLGVAQGDVAGVFFSGSEFADFVGRPMLGQLAQYIALDLNLGRDE